MSLDGNLGDLGTTSDAAALDLAVPDSTTPDATGVDAGACVDSCPFTGGIRSGCATRFAYGLNYAWYQFGTDFGGLELWGHRGVAAERDANRANLADMRAHGANVVRWWVLPDFRGDGVAFDDEERPIGVGPTLEADVAAALELAAESDVWLMLCLFSFDAFRPSQDVAGSWTPGLSAIARDPALRAELMERVVRPVARAAAASPHRDRLHSWDVINEPEWAMTGPSPFGDEDYDPGEGLDPVTHAEMAAFVADVTAVLRAESAALVTVGGAALKWRRAWTGVGVDFYQFHIYDWVDAYWPYDAPASMWELDRPIVMGEHPLGGLARASYSTILDAWYANGFAGALAWHHAESTEAQLDEVAAFAAAHPCETDYASARVGARSWRPTRRIVAPANPGRLCRVHDGRASCLSPGG